MFGRNGQDISFDFLGDFEHLTASDSFIILIKINVAELFCDLIDQGRNSIGKKIITKIITKKLHIKKLQ